MWDFRVLGSKFVKFLILILNWKVSSSSNFASFFIVIIHFQLWTKGCHQSPSFETCKSSGETFPNSSCHFWKYKSVFLQTFYRSWVPSNITPLYFLSSNILRFSFALVKICQIPHVIFQIWRQQFFFKFAWLFSIMKDNSSVLF